MSVNIKIEKDLVVGTTYSFDKDGGKMDRYFCVRGLSSLTGSQTGTSQTIYLATIARDTTTGFTIPQYGQVHESIPGLFCQNVQAKPLANDSRDACMVICHYGWQSFSLGQVQIRLTGTRNVLHANRDPTTGNLFVVTYNQPAGKPAGGIVNVQITALGNFPVNIVKAAPPQNVSQLCEFNISNFHLTLEVSRVETQSPKRKAAAYVGRVNQEVNWQGVGGGKARQWICQSIEGTIMQNGWYNVTYVFEFAPEGWWQIALYQDPATHIIPGDVLEAAANGAGVVGNVGILNIGWAFAKNGQIANGQYGYTPDSVPFNALNIPNV